MTLDSRRTKIQLNGLDHFALNVKDMKRSLKFYNELLGFPIIQKSTTQAGLQHIEVDAGNVAISREASRGGADGYDRTPLRKGKLDAR